MEARRSHFRWQVILGAWLAFGIVAGWAGPSRLSLSGKWRFQLDPERRGEAESWFQKELAQTIALPGTTDQAGVGGREPAVDRGHLVRAHRYVGPAWYQREVDIPETWRAQWIELRIERALWTTRVWVDGELRGGVEDSLTTEHRHALGILSPGRHRLTVCVDNDLHVNIGTLSHSYTEETQSMWNGMVGRLELAAEPMLAVEGVRPFYDASDDQVRVEVAVTNRLGRPAGGVVVARLRRADGKLVAEGSAVINADHGYGQETLALDTISPLPRWDEFDPQLCRLEVEWQAGGLRERREWRTGLREWKRQGTALLLNGRPVFLRGNVECCVFPRTGHPPMHVQEWREIFKVAREHGFNHFRFHTWCPPDAAFAAADELGIYLNPETPTWTDGFWPDEFTAPRMAKRPLPFGEDPAVVEFARRELQRIQEAYGHHPSLAMITIGNELGKADWKRSAQIIEEARARDPRFLYAVSTARELTPADDYWVTHATKAGGVRGLGKPSTDWDFSAGLREVPVPLLGHETGQRPVFPDYRTLGRYTGPLKPWNLEVFRERLRARGLLQHNRIFTEASAAWALAQYRHEIEGFLRTPGLAGYQLLQLNDFTGQTEALVGLLDPFWQPKSSIKPAQWQPFQSATVPLVRLPKFVWEEGEQVQASAWVSQFGPWSLDKITSRWWVTDERGREVARGEGVAMPVSPSGLSRMGDIQFVLPRTRRPERFDLHLTVGLGENAWRLWSYPKVTTTTTVPAGVRVIERWDEATARAVAAGERLVLLARGLKNASAFRGHFYSIYWSAVMFAQPEGTLGIWCDPRHHALSGFPNDGHSDWSWRTLVEGSTVFVLDNAPAGLNPIVGQVPDFHDPHRLASVFEVRVGNGRLLVCGLNVATDDPAGRAMRASLLDYAASSAFRPQTDASVDWLNRLLEPAANR